MERGRAGAATQRLPRLALLLAAACVGPRARRRAVTPALLPCVGFPHGRINSHNSHNHTQVSAVAFDNPIPGFKTRNCNNLRLWAAKPSAEFDLQAFNTGDYVQVGAGRASRCVALFASNWGSAALTCRRSTPATTCRWVRVPLIRSDWPQKPALTRDKSKASAQQMPSVA